MRFEGRMEGAAPVMAKCPVCGVVVPMIEVTVQRYGLFGRRTAVVVDGDATDFVAHLWQHRESVNSDI